MNTCLKFLSSSLLHSGKNSEFMPPGFSQSGPCLQVQNKLSSSLLQALPRHIKHFPRVSYSHTLPYCISSASFLSQDSTQSTVEFRKPSLTPPNWEDYTSYVICASTPTPTHPCPPLSTLGIPVSQHLLQCLLSRNCGRLSVYLSTFFPT